MKRILFVVLALTIFTLTACAGHSGEGNTSALDAVPAEYAGQSNPLGPDAALEGAKVFKTNCVSCHGIEGHGDGPASAALDPRPKNLAELQATTADDYLYWRISTGKDGTSMVAWKDVLTVEQIWQVIAYINTLK